MSGTVLEGEKDGTISYYNCSNNSKVDYIEVYKKGYFRSSSSEISKIANIPFSSMELTSSKFENVDGFYHKTPFFGEDETSDKLALDFITNKNFYGIPSSAITFEDNYKDFYNVIAYVLNERLMRVNKYSYASSIIDDNDRMIFNKVGLQNNSGNQTFQPKVIKGNIAITIDTTGYVSNSVFKGNFEKNEIDKINYFLSTIYRLKPYKENGSFINKEINIKVYNHTDSTMHNDSVKAYYYSYVIENADKKDIEPIPFIPQIEAKFPGGQDAWLKYLRKNLNVDILSDNHAPDGTYKVVVSFVVDEKGNLSQVTALNNPGYGTAEEAVRIIQSGPAWTPAVNEGKNVMYKQKQSISFQIKHE